MVIIVLYEDIIVHILPIALDILRGRRAEGSAPSRISVNWL